MLVAQYISAGVVILVYVVSLVLYSIFYLPGGLAKFHSIMSAWISSFFGLLACLLFFTKFDVGLSERIVFYLLIPRVQDAYAHAVWDYLRLDDFIGSMQSTIVSAAAYLIFLSALVVDLQVFSDSFDVNADIVGWLLFAAAPVLYTIWAGVCFFFRHRISHREYLVIGMAYAYFIAYTIVTGLRFVIPTWVAVLLYSLVFIFLHNVGMLLTVWYDNLTKGLNKHPWFASWYGYDKLKQKPSTEMLRQIAREQIIEPPRMSEFVGSSSRN